MFCPECIFVVTLHYQMVHIGKLFGLFQYLESFLVKIWVFDTRGLHVQGYPQCYAINFEELTPCFVLNVYLRLFCIIKWSKQGSSMDNINIWCRFWSKCVFLTPRGLHVQGYPHCYAINFEEIPSCFVVNVYLWLLCIIKWSKSEVIWIIPIFGVILVKMWVFDPPGVHVQGYPHCYAINFEEIP